MSYTSSPLGVHVRSRRIADTVRTVMTSKQGIGRAAAIIMAGTLAVSALGFVRALVLARAFGAGHATDALFAALFVPQTIFDQFVGSALPAVFLPVFVRARTESGDLQEAVATAGLLVLVPGLVVVALLEWASAPALSLAASGFNHGADHAVLAAATGLLRLMLPSLLLLSLAAILSAALYAQERRTLPTLARGALHLGVIGGALVGGAAGRIEPAAAGLTVGAALQCGVTAAALLRTGWRPAWPTRRSPLLARLARFYLPVAAGGAIALAGVLADLELKSHLPELGGLSAMQYATQLVQFPLGIVATGLSLALIPPLTLSAGREQTGDPLIRGIRLSLLLLLPAAVGMLLLASPIVTAVFAHGRFNAAAVHHTVLALRGYAPQLPLVGLWGVLASACYARHDTRSPALAAGAGILVYVALGAALLPPFTIFGLALANTMQFAVQNLVLLAVLNRAGYHLSWQALRLPSLAIPVAALAGTVGTITLLLSRLGPLQMLTVAALLGGVAYLTALRFAGWEEVDTVHRWLGRRVMLTRM